MASRIQSLRRPLTIAAATAAVGGTGLYAYANSRKHTISMPIVEAKRDSQGRIVPPTFPALKSRKEQLDDLRRHDGSSSDAEYDLLIIGGGATGTGIAVDAATRGLKVALVERDDFSSGTSSKSTKLVHGGVRYLEKAVMNLDYPQLELVIEALRERRTFLNIAPHLSNSVPILLPLQQWWQAPYMWCGTKAYDLLAGSQGLEGSYFMTKSKAWAEFPLLRRNNMVGALIYYDGQHNDSRMNVSLALTASLYGATVLNHFEVTSLEKDANGKITGVKGKDVLSSLDKDADGAQEFQIRAKGVINATGPFADAIEHMDDGSRKPLVSPAAGAHVILPGRICPNGKGLLEASTSDGRVVFVLPWQGKTLAGTTDNACEVEREPVALQKDVDFILTEVNKLLLPEAAVTRNDVLASWSGIRPLVRDPKAKNTESLVRSHLVTVSPSGLLTCAGGKWTTYRQMAEDAVDEAVKTFNLKPSSIPLPDISGTGLPGFSTTGKCCTLTTPLIGAHGYSPELASQLMSVHSVDADVAEHLAINYGDRAWAVLATNATSRVVPTLPFIEAEFRHGVRSESACTAADLISRRTRMAFLDVGVALKALPRVIDIMAEELNWTEARKQLEWTQTVHFFKSMGLPEEKLNVTKEEVLSSIVQDIPPHHQPSPIRSEGGAQVGGLGSFDGTIAARNITPN